MAERMSDDEFEFVEKALAPYPLAGPPDVFKGMSECPYCGTDTSAEMAAELRERIDELEAARPHPALVPPGSKEKG